MENFNEFMKDGWSYPKKHCEGSADPEVVEQLVNKYLQEIGQPAGDIRVLVGLSATKTKTVYDMDETIGLDDLTVTATYNDGSECVIDNYSTNIDEISTLTDGFKKLEITHCHNGVTKQTSIPINVTFSKTVDNVQYAYCISNKGRLNNNTPVIKLTSKLLKRSKLSMRLKIKVIVERNNNSGYTTIGLGNYSIWNTPCVVQEIILPKSTGEYILELNRELEFSHANLSPNDTVLFNIINNSGNKVDGSFEILEYSLSVIQEAPLLVESISATKTATRYFIGDVIDSTDISVTALMSDDTTKSVSDFEIEYNVENIDDYGKMPLSVIYTENEVTNTTAITLKMYRPFLTEAQEFDDITNFELHDRLGLGINIGNCLDSKATTQDIANCVYDGWLNQETAWGQPEIIRQNFIDIKNKGFNTVRIPVTWCYNSGVLEDGNRHPGRFWLARINEVVQIGLEEGLYIMINMHHEQPIIFAGVSDAQFETVLKNASDMWTYIADVFKYYNERLIFEGYNEVDNLESSFNYGEKAALQMNRLNQVFVDAVRSTGENNAKRILVCPTLVHMNSIPALNAFVTPTDIVENKIILGVHAYPLTFAQDLENELRNIEEYASKYDLPVLITEWGSDNKGGNGSESVAMLPYGSDQRPAHAQNFMARTTNRGIKSYWWDNGSNFTLVIRCNKRIDYGYKQEELDKIIDAMKVGYESKKAYVLPEENLIRFDSFDNLVYERLNTQTGESSYANWSDVSSDYIPVVAGKGIILSVVKVAKAVTEKTSFANICFMDENKVPISSASGSYLSTRYAGTIPDEAKYMRFSVNSPHNNTKKETYTEMFESGDLAIDVIFYVKDDITEVTLGEREIIETIVQKDKETYAVGDELNTDDITVIALLEDDTKVYINDYNIDVTGIDMSVAGEKAIGISYVYKSNTVESSVAVFVGDALMSISASVTSKTCYIGDQLSIDDVVITANYSSGTMTDVTSLCVIDTSLVDIQEAGEYTINVSYEEAGVTKLCKIAVTIKEFNINDFISESIAISEQDISGITYPVPDEILAEYPYVIVDTNNPIHTFVSKVPMYLKGKNSVVFDLESTLHRTNNNVFVKPNESQYTNLVKTYCYSYTMWMLNKANYDVHDWK